MRDLYLLSHIWLPLDLEHLLNDLQLLPFSIYEMMRAFFVKFLLPKVTVICNGSSEAPREMLCATHCDTWHANERGANGIILSPHKLIQLPEGGDRSTQVRIGRKQGHAVGCVLT